MLQSMNVFHHQTTRPKFLHFPASCHGRRIPHKPPALVSFPAKMEFNPKFLHCSRKSVLVSSPATMKFSSVLFALPRDDEEFSPDNGEEHSTGASISSDNGEYVVREAKFDEEFWASARLKAEGFYEERSDDRYVGSFKKKHAEQEYNVIKRRCKERTIQPYMCIIAVRKEGENAVNTMLKNVIGTLDYRVKYLLRGETYPEEVVKVKTFTTFKKRDSQRYCIISNVTVAQSARRMGVGSSMLKFAIESAKQNGIKRVFLHVRRDNKPALALYEKLGFKILAEATTPHLEEHNLYLCSINL
ncbi:hypothetical protein MKW98_006292 [Papaver atlanticum]|uniref:N-acetyltransferase domain-containing protein n=1 Tax=Papaver atlanticum TaxID=357466 RepID=A0AAD4TGY8_9MAGN|nr:hypothetical protein MKW98_006292 [Papaver atlanticum]